MLSRLRFSHFLHRIHILACITECRTITNLTIMHVCRGQCRHNWTFLLCFVVFPFASLLLTMADRSPRRRRSARFATLSLDD